MTKPSYVQVAPDSTGKLVQNEELATDAGVVERQVIAIEGKTAQQIVELLERILLQLVAVRLALNRIDREDSTLSLDDLRAAENSRNNR